MNGPTFEERIDRYQRLVETYHATLDLVSPTALERFPSLVEQAQAYAAAIAEAAPLGDILDLGSGAGLPGVVIAARFPDRRVWLVERRRRRATFLRMVVARLALDEAMVIEADVTDLRPEDLGLPGGRFGSEAGVDGGDGALRGPRFDLASDVDRVDGIRVITAQAVAPFADIYCLTRHLHASSVMLASRKGPDWRAEVDAVTDATGAAPAILLEPTPIGGGTLVCIDVRGGLPCQRSA